MKSSVIFGFVLSLILHALVLMFFLFSFYTQEKSSGVDFKQGLEFTSIMRSIKKRVILKIKTKNKTKE